MASHSSPTSALAVTEPNSSIANDETTKMSSSITSSSTPSLLPAFIREPLGEHRHSMIILHGSGDSGSSFGTILVGDPNRPQTIFFRASDAGIHTITEDQILPKALPHVRFIFPSATLRPMARFKNWPCNQWFDCYSHYDPSKRPDTQDTGLRENASLIEDLIEEEARKVGIENVVVGGLSNGAAMALIAVLTMIGRGKLNAERRLGGVFSLCGWLPYAADMSGVAQGAAHKYAGDAALRWLVDRLNLPHDTEGPRIPEGDAEMQADRRELALRIFIAHGKEDNVVPLERLHDAYSALKAMGFEVRSHEYANLDHWYSDEMLNDLVSWIECQ